MSKETTQAMQCACGQFIYYTELHWPHCPANPVNLGKSAEGRAVLSKLNTKFSKAELAAIATHGPVPDEKPKAKNTKRGKRPAKKVGAKK